MKRTARTTLLVLLLVASYPVESVKCHKCVGASAVPQDVEQQIASLNLSHTIVTEGDCKAKIGDSVCTGTTFCMQKIIKYSVKYKQSSLSWIRYEKGCANVREDNGEEPEVACYDVPPKENHTEYTKTEQHCYCMDFFCNSSTTSTYSLIYFVLVVFLLR